MKKNTEIRFWLICIAAILSINTILYFSLKIPALKKEVTEIHREKALEKEFRANLKEIDKLFDQGSNINKPFLRSSLAHLSVEVRDRYSTHFLNLYKTATEHYWEKDVLKQEEKSLKLAVKQQNEELRESYSTLRSLLDKKGMDHKEKFKKNK